MSNTNREAFEAWATKFRSNAILRRFENGEYVSAVTENYFNVWQAAIAQVNANEKSQAQQERTKLIPMPTEESPRQWFFDCDDLYIDVEHLNGEVSIFVKHRSDNVTGWKELIEKPQEQQPTALSKQLREYAADSGYSHNDYADTMLAAASEIERLTASQAQQEPLKVSENWREPLSADAMQRLKNLGVLDKSPAPEGGQHE